MCTLSWTWPQGTNRSAREPRGRARDLVPRAGRTGSGRTLVRGDSRRVGVPAPAVASEAVRRGRMEDRVFGSRGRSERKGLCMGERILVVDDEPRNVRLLVAILQPLGFTVSTATNGREAL